MIHSLGHNHHYFCCQVPSVRLETGPPWSKWAGIEGYIGVCIAIYLFRHINEVDQYGVAGFGV